MSKEKISEERIKELQENKMFQKLTKIHKIVHFNFKEGWLQHIIHEHADSKKVKEALLEIENIMNVLKLDVFEKIVVSTFLMDASTMTTIQVLLEDHKEEEEKHGRTP